MELTDTKCWLGFSQWNGVLFLSSVGSLGFLIILPALLLRCQLWFLSARRRVNSIPPLVVDIQMIILFCWEMLALFKLSCDSVYTETGAYWIKDEGKHWLEEDSSSSIWLDFPWKKRPGYSMNLCISAQWKSGVSPAEHWLCGEGNVGKGLTWNGRN